MRPGDTASGLADVSRGIGKQKKNLFDELAKTVFPTKEK